MHLQEPDDYRKLEVANAPRNYKAYTIAISVISLIVIGVLVAAVAILAQAEEAPSALRTVPETVPLKSKDIVVKAVQSNTVCTLDIPSNFSSLSQSEQDAVEAQLQACIDENVDHVITLFDQACSEGPKPDIVVFHEFPFTGYFSSDRAGKLAASIEIPGPQSDKMKEKTMSCGCYTVFGSYVKDPVDWPGHIFSMTTLITPEGDVTPTWKTRNIKRSQLMPGTEITTTTVEGLYDRYVKKYGEDNVFPIFRTPVGNLAISSVQLDPLVFQTFAELGAEIFLRTATLYFPSDVKYNSLCNNVYSAMANIPYPDPLYGGNSVIMDPMGEIIGLVNSSLEEGIATAKIPLQEFRDSKQTWPTGRNIPAVSKAINLKVFNRYKEEIPLNHMDLTEDQLFSEVGDGVQMYNYFNSISTWLN